MIVNINEKGVQRMKTTITIEIEDRKEGTRLTMKGDINHGFQTMCSAMGYATWVATSDAPEYIDDNTNMQAGTWLPDPKFVDN